MNLFKCASVVSLTFYIWDSPPIMVQDFQVSNVELGVKLKSIRLQYQRLFEEKPLELETKAAHLDKMVQKSSDLLFLMERGNCGYWLDALYTYPTFKFKPHDMNKNRLLDNLKRMPATKEADTLPEYNDLKYKLSAIVDPRHVDLAKGIELMRLVPDDISLKYTLTWSATYSSDLPSKLKVRESISSFLKSNPNSIGIHVAYACLQFDIANKADPLTADFDGAIKEIESVISMCTNDKRRAALMNEVLVYAKEARAKAKVMSKKP